MQPKKRNQRNDADYSLSNNADEPSELPFVSFRSGTRRGRFRILACGRSQCRRGSGRPSLHRCRWRASGPPLHLCMRYAHKNKLRTTIRTRPRVRIIAMATRFCSRKGSGHTLGSLLPEFGLDAFKHILRIILKPEGTEATNFMR